MKSKVNIPAGVMVFIALALLALSAVITLPQLSPNLAFGQVATPLQPPANLTAVTVGQKNIALVWTPPAVTGTGYMVERSKDGRTGWVMVGSSEAGATTYNDMDTSLELSTRYYYRVSTTTTTPNRRSRPSNVANATTGGVLPPGAPTDLELTEQGPSRIDLSWTAPSPETTGGGDITGYKIEYSNAASATPADSTWDDLVANTMNDKTTYTDDGSVAMLEEGDERHYRVSAINSAGAGMASISVRSDPTPPGAIIETSAPTGLMAVAMGPTQIDLSWTAPTDTSGDEIMGYKIESADYNATTGIWASWRDLQADTENDDTTYADKSLTMEKTTRQYRVSAINAATDDSPPSNVANATTAEATVPGKPNAPTLTPEEAQQIDLEWTVPTNNGGTAITGYRIERSENGSTWPAKPLVANNATLTYMDEAVPKANTRWYYRVSAINAVGTGEPSDTTHAVTPPVSVAPQAPTGLTAWEYGSTRIVLQWQAPDPTGGEITGYKIEYASAQAADPDTVDSTTWDDLVEDTMSMATTYTDDGSVDELKAGDIRFYRVSTINSGGTSTSPSNVYSAITGTTALMVPANLTAQNTGQKSITLSWGAVTGTGYMVERSKDGRTGWVMVGSSEAGATTYNDMDTSLELSTRYYYRVSTTTTTPNRRSRPSNVANATTGGVLPPGAPTDLELTEQGPSRIDLSWTAPSPETTGGGDITGYKIEYSNAASATPADSTWDDLVANTMNDKTTYTDDGSVAMLEEGDERHYRVSAINSAGAGMASISVRSDPTPPGAIIRDQCADGPDGRGDGADANRSVMDCADGHQRR